MPIVKKNVASRPREIFGLTSERLSSIPKYVLHDNHGSHVDNKGKTDHLKMWDNVKSKNLVSIFLRQFF